MELYRMAGPIAATQGVQLEKTFECESRKKIEEDIITTLRGENVNMIGICGMGGLGKTTMAKKIMNRVLEEHVFDEVVIATVSHNVDISKIQDDIGGQLGLEMLKVERSQPARIQILHSRLSNTKRILLVLDDVWETLVLEEFGIPRDSKGCTILLTSRNRDVLHAMDVQIFGMEVLSEEEAWSFFREGAGTCVDDTNLNSIAKEIAQECRGLPIALKALGLALKDKKAAIWNNALRELKHCDADIPIYRKEVYTPLILSYNFLDSEKAKSLFLLCCLFPEDANIPLEYLTNFCMGLSKFKGITNMEDARNMMCALIELLKDRSLLLDSEYEDCVRMHDVVRDVCLFIAKEEGYIAKDGCTWISSSHLVEGERNELLSGSRCPNLDLLFLNSRYDDESLGFKFDDAFLKGIGELQVLCIERYSLTTLPHPMQSLGKLNTLILDSCDELETISVVGELVNLEILICRNCGSIEKLPSEMKGLNRLKLLELTGCSKLQSIGRGIISSLVGLEELKMCGSFDKWEGEDREERENAGARLRELEALTKLACLEIDIKDPSLVSENMPLLSKKIVRFIIRTDRDSIFGYNPTYFLSKSSKIMSLCLERETRLGDWIEMQFLRDTEYLYLRNIRWVSSSHLVGERNELLSGSRCPNLDLLFLDSRYDDNSLGFKFDDAFMEGMRELHVLCIQNYYSLTTLPYPTQSLGKLNTLILDSCRQLETISVVGELVNLEILICRHCYSIEELPSEMKGLNRLKVLELTWCEKLQSIGRGIISSLVGLEELKMEKSFNRWEAEDREERENAGLRELEALTNLVCLDIDIKDPSLVSENMPLLSKKIYRFRISTVEYSYLPFEFSKAMSLCLERETRLGDWIEMQFLKDAECLELKGNGANNVDLVKIQNIRWLKLRDCESMKNVDATVFPSIEHLELWSLPELQEICDGPISSTSFQNLKELHLYWLTALTQFWKSSSVCENNYVPHFTNLSSIKIYDCPSLRNLGQLSMAGKDCLPQLERLHIKYCLMMEQVFLWNEEESGENKTSIESHHVITKVFPKLKEVRLYNLPNLTIFYQGIQGIEFPLLTTMTIEECPKMKSIIGSNSADIDDDGSLHLLCQPQKISFGSSLEVLEIDYNPFCGHEIPSSLFNGLEVLTINKYVGSMSFFTLSKAANLASLRELSIVNCDEMIKVIEDEQQVESGGQRILLFHKLEILKLKKLPKLVSFCNWKCEVELPLLRKVEITDCPKMGNFSLGFVATPNLEAFTTDLTAYVGIGVDDTFDSLKELEIKGNENPLYHHKIISASLFNGLEKLIFSWCKGSMSLFSSSAVGNLVNLRVLVIFGGDLVNVIEDGEEKEDGKVVSGGQIKTVLFPKLKELRLGYLPKLVRFCEWKCDVELPSLTKVVINDCPNMENFSMGFVAAPNLIVEIDEEIGATKDLNGMLHQHYLAGREKNPAWSLQKWSRRFKEIPKISTADSSSSSISEYEIEQLFVVEIAEEGILVEDSKTKMSRNLPFSVSGFDSQQRVQPECHKEIQAVDEMMTVTDAEQQVTEHTTSNSGRSKHHEESITCPIYFQEEGLYLVVEENNHLQLILDDQIILIGDYPSPSPPETSPVNAMLSLVEQDLREIPETPNYPNSLILFLQRNKRLTLFHPSFFNTMRDLHFLDMSDTKIRILPSSLFNLHKLKVLLLRNCICLEKIPPEIAELKNMEVLDLSGTELYDLPDEISQLELLKSVQLSFYGPDDESEYEHLPSRLVSPNVLSKLEGIQKLGVCVHPEDHRWIETVACIIKDISKLEMLKYLQFYFPKVEMFEKFIETSPSWKNQGLSKFNLIIGQNVKRIASRVPDEVESLFSQKDRCLRYVNGDKTFPLIKTALIRVTAFYLDHHTVVQSLSEFDVSNFQALKFCVVRECPKIKAILDEKNAGSAFPCLEDLGIYFLWELKHIWKLHSKAGRLKRIFKTPMPSRNFEALKNLTINTCPKLQFVFWESMLQCLTNLEELVVKDCEGMVKIIKEENKKVKYENNALPKLRKLELHYLPELVSLGYGVHLSEVEIIVSYCPKLILNSQP